MAACLLCTCLALPNHGTPSRLRVAVRAGKFERLAVAHIAICKMLVWLAINIAFVMLRLWVTRPSAPIVPHHRLPQDVH